MGGAEQREGTWTYRPHLDGLRAVAVYLVVAFHAGIGRAAGGFIGVDVFFVLSGYLVTNILLRDLGQHGRVRFGRFYARRSRRLLPAAALSLVVTAVVFRAIAAPAELAAARDSIRWASLYASNWHFIAESADYFGADVDASPVAHYWSLSVEEQFYLLWPLVLAAVHRVARPAGRHAAVVVRALVATAAVASLAAAVLISRTDVDRAYFGTDTRAYQLLAGALLALSPTVLARARRLPGAVRLLPVASVGLVGALAAVASWRFTAGPVTRGIAATAVTAALIVSLEAADGGVGRRLLSWRPLVFLGSISYGTYLWHWLVVVVIARQLDLSHVATFAVAAPVATGLAALSFELLERPVREAPALDRLRGPVIAVGLVASLLVGVVVAPRLLEPSDTAGGGAAVVATAAGTPNRTDWRSAFADKYTYERCTPSQDAACRLTSGSGATVLVVGESHAAMYLPMLEQLAERHDWSLYGGLLDYCPWTRGLGYATVGRNCLADQERLYDQVAPALDPDIVILAHRPIDDPANGMRMRAAEGALPEDRQEAELARHVRAVAADLRADGRTVVLLEPVPAPPSGTNPLTCLSEAEHLEACRFVASRGPTAEERVFRQLDADDEGIVSIDLDRGICPYLPICDPVVGGEVVRWDETHLTQTFAVTLLDGIDRVLVDEGVAA